MDQNLVNHLIHKGECEDVEFKHENVRVEDIAETICAFANKRGGYILFGVEDGTRNILGVTNIEKLKEKLENANRDRVNPMAELENSTIEFEGQKIVIAYIKAGNTLYTESKARRIFLRTGMSDSPADIDAIIKILNDRGRMQFEDFPLNEATYEDLDIESVKRYLRLKEGTNAQREPKTILASMGLLKDNKPTVATILLFGAYPQTFFPASCIHATKFQNREKKDDKGKTIVEDEDFPIKEIIIGGNLYNLILDAIDFIMNESKGFDSLLDAIWEAIVNAVVHRDYSIPGAIELRVWDDRIEIKNPGGLVGGRTLNNLLANPMSIARNPKIARIMSELRCGDNRCKGVHKIRMDSISNDKAEDAIFSEDPWSFSVILSLRMVKEQFREQEVDDNDAE